ncbi:MAG: hypothetical protein DRG31_03630 [Deltaproteobacteria bacterium]|nr:MAG: hypothetical protein DRG31_03630 [Deltaproteobacteria bacterium]
MRGWAILIVSLLFFSAITQGSERMARGPIRESAIAGTWYPGDPKILRRQIEGFLSHAEVPPLEGELLALIAPHAGYMYSGQVAAYAYKLLLGKKYDTVVIISPSHYVYFRGVSIYPRGGFRTPLGVVRVQERFCKRLMDVCPLVDDIPQAHTREHALEIQLPFLQVVLGDFGLVPLVMGEQDNRTVRELAKGLVEVIRHEGKRVLLIASTDLSHFYPYERAVALDRIILEHVEALDPEGLMRDLESKRCEACGGGPMVSAMMAAKALGANKGVVLKYANSGDVTGDRTSVVGYMSAALLKLSEDPDPLEEEYLGLSEEEKRTLLEIARTVIESRALGKPIPEFSVTSPKLKEPRGVFVTIKKHGQLRGCIGYVRGIKPLWEAVVDMAQAAAFEDPRFPPVRPEELKDLEIEISVLTPLKEIRGSPEEILRRIKIGEHGLMIERPPYHSGLLLPQVAVEYGWDPQTFLEETCFKAGLPPDAWRDPSSRIYIFGAEIF